MEHPKPTSPTGAIFVKCLSCGKLVQLPADHDPNAIVRCPRCSETYPVGMLFDSEIPELEFVDPQPVEASSVPLEGSPDSNQEAAVKTDGQNRFIVAPALAKGAKHKKRRRSRSRSDSSSSDRSRTESRSSKNSSDRSSSSSRSSQSRSRSSKSAPPREKSGGWELTKVMLGALMAPPVAQLVIWWGLQMDPLNLGPKFASVIPAVVPEKFHPPQEDENQQDPTVDETAEEEKQSIKFLPKPPSNIENRGIK